MVGFLGALAAAGPLAVAKYGQDGDGSSPDWLGDLSWLASELAEEAARRLLRLQEAGQVWQRRAEEMTKSTGDRNCGKEEG